MGAVTVQGVSALRGLAQYVVYGRAEMRRQHLDAGTNRLAVSYVEGEGIEEFVAKAERMARAYSRKVMAHSYVQSYPSWLFDVDKDEDRQRVNELGTRLAKKMHPGSDVWVVTHADGEGRCLHNHIIVINHVDETGRSAEGYRLPVMVRDAENELMDEEGLPKIEYGDQQLSWPERRKKLSDRIFLVHLGDTVYEAVRDPRSVGLDSLTEVLAERDVEMVVDPENGGITYRMMDEVTPGKAGRKRRSKASRLSPDFTSKGLEATFVAKQAGVPTPPLAMTPAQQHQVATYLGLVDADGSDALAAAMAEYIAEHDPQLLDTPGLTWEQASAKHLDALLRAELDQRAAEAAARAAAPAAPSAAAPPSAPPGYQASTEQDDEADLDEADLDEPDASEGYLDGATLTAAASVAHQRPVAGRDAGLYRAEESYFDADDGGAPAELPYFDTDDARAAPTLDPAAVTAGRSVSAVAPTDPADAVALADEPVSAVAPAGQAVSSDTPTSTSAVAVAEPDPVSAVAPSGSSNTPRPYVSRLRHFEPQTPWQREHLPGAIALDEAQQARLAAGERVDEERVATTRVGPKWLREFGAYVYPPLREQLELREAKKASRNEHRRQHIELFGKLTETEQTVRARDPLGWRQDSTYLELARQARVAQRRTIARDEQLAAGVYEEVSSWDPARPPKLGEVVVRQIAAAELDQHEDMDSRGDKDDDRDLGD